MQQLLAEPGVSSVVGHMCRQGMRLQSPDGRVLPVRKPTRWASSAREVLKRLGLRCANETCQPGDPHWHDHTALEGRLPGGQLRTEAAAHYPPALCASILWGWPFSMLEKVGQCPRWSGRSWARGARCMTSSWRVVWRPRQDPRVPDYPVTNSDCSDY